MILKIDETRRNIVVSRRRLIEEAREKMKKELLENINVGDLRTGTVKNIADFGAFVDLGGIDGLLHITDMSWGRINHPTEMVKIDDQIEVMILNIDYEKEKIALGLKQKTASPWENISEKYPVGTRITGEVVNVLSYGAFVKLEDGIEGLVHISEMSWTRRVNHPSELVSIGDEVEVMVLGINEEKQEISLGMKQTQANPWDNVVEKYPVGEKVSGTVRNLTNYGAFVELEEGVDGLLHISDMSWTRKISHSNEMLKKGDPIECQILSVDEERRRIALGLKQLEEDPWETRIPEKYSPGSTVKGKVTKITNFGVFVELEDELEGLLHVSELADHKVEHPESLVNVGEEIEVRILRVDTADRKIGLSCRSDEEIKEAAAAAESGEVSGDSGATRDREVLKGGTGSGAGPLFSLGGSADTSESKEEEAEEESAE
jgi:small subunit ribosomal protein S1